MRISAIPIFAALCLSFQKEESFAFHWTTNLHRKTRKSPSRFHLFSINTRIQNMRLQPRRSRIDGGSEGRVRTSRSSSVSIDDGSAENFKQQPSASFNWWGKDPRNRSVSGILIGGSKKDWRSYCWQCYPWNRSNRSKSFFLDLLESMLSFFSLSSGIHNGRWTAGKFSSSNFS